MPADDELPAAEETAEHVGGLWRNRDFRLIWSGRALSELGTGISQLAYPVLMLTITRARQVRPERWLQFGRSRTCCSGCPLGL